MKRIGWMLLLLLTVAPAWAASKLTIADLNQKLATLHQSQSDDDEVATQLKQVALSEQLTPAARAALNPLLPGPLSQEQINILQIRTSFLAPPAADLPTTPAPDPAAQEAILAKAQDFVAKSYSQNPHLAVSRFVSRFQDDAGNSSSSPGLVVNTPNTFTRLVEAHTEQVETDKGIEKPSPAKAKTKWGENGSISEGEPGPFLSSDLQDIASNGKVDWLRWETIDGKQIAVFSFAVDKKKSHFDLSYCCFPITDQSQGAATGEGAVQPATGNIQSVTTWRPFKKVVGFHGEIFIDPTTGAVVRFISYADPKPTDFVHQEVMRTDYAPVVVEGKEYTLPVDSYTFDEVVPGGDSAAYTVRHTLFNAKYQNYRLAGSAH